MNFEKLSEIIVNKGCKLAWSREEFNEKYKTTASKIEIVSSCGHNTIVQTSDFLHKNTGILCKQCVINKSKTKDYTNTDNILIEYQTIKALEKNCKDIQFKILDDCTLADIAIRPIVEQYDLWLPIQVKTTKSNSFKIYNFHINKLYKNMYILLFCSDEQRLWLLNGNDITIKKLNIGQYKSKYNKYEVKLSKLSETLIDKYNNDIFNFKRPLFEINIPISNNVKREKEFKEYRESIFPNLIFTYSEITNRVFDCVINDKFKIQDKVISNYNDNNKLKWFVKICRNTKNGNRMYKLGDNDFYWLSLPDKKGAYILPENILFEHNMISSTNEDKNSLMIQLFPYHHKNKLHKLTNGWFNDYLYFYETDIEKITKLFEYSNKADVILNYYTPLDLTSITTNTIKNLVNKIIQRVIDNNDPKNDAYICCDCNKILTDYRITRCDKCYRLNSRKVERPFYQQLIDELEKSNYTKLGIKYGVSDTCIKKWIQYYEKSLAPSTGLEPATPRLIL